LSFDKTLSTTGHCWTSLLNPSEHRAIEKLLHEEEAKLKKYDEDHQNKSPRDSKTG